MRRLRIVYLIIVLFVLPLATVAQGAPLTGLDAYIDKALKDWEVPGLALAIVRGDSVVHVKGYGVRELGKPEPVTPFTVFAIGSSSKAFTAALVGMLVDEGKVRWDDPIAKHLPGLQLYDPYVSKELTVRDALSHRSGLARGDRLWYASELSRDDILNRVRYLAPTWSFRSNFGYQNLMYLAAGQMAAKVAGKSWDDLVAEKIFAPLGMRSTNTSIKKLTSLSDVSTPHARINQKVAPIKWRLIDNIAPAGSINSTATDMAQWVRLQLGKGTYAGKALLKPATVREFQSANTVIRSDARTDSLLPETHLRAYGLGWFLEDYRGRKLVHHGGNIDGMSALVFMVPEENFGLVILTNMNGTSLPAALAHRIADLYMGGAKRDWSADYLAFTKEGQRRAALSAQNTENSRVKDTKPSLPLEKYAGTYENEMYGAVKLEVKDGKLLMNAGPSFIGPLEHWNYDTFRVNWSDPMAGRTMVTFVLDAQGRAATIKVDGLADFQRQFGRTQ